MTESMGTHTQLPWASMPKVVGQSWATLGMNAQGVGQSWAIRCMTFQTFYLYEQER